MGGETVEFGYSRLKCVLFPVLMAAWALMFVQMGRGAMVAPGVDPRLAPLCFVMAALGAITAVGLARDGVRGLRNGPAILIGPDAVRLARGRDVTVFQRDRVYQVDPWIMKIGSSPGMVYALWISTERPPESWKRERHYRAYCPQRLFVPFMFLLVRGGARAALTEALATPTVAEPLTPPAR